jgi:hypothetical protein
MRHQSTLARRAAPASDFPSTFYDVASLNMKFYQAPGLTSFYDQNTLPTTANTTLQCFFLSIWSQPASKSTDQ